jgi:hypothetical protein
MIESAMQVPLRRDVASGSMAGGRGCWVRKEHASHVTRSGAETASATQRLFGAAVVGSASAVALFDRLEPVNAGYLQGLWQGEELWTGHRLNGLLSAFGWYGKEFLAHQRAHPLVFTAAERRFVFDPPPLPASIVLRMPAPAAWLMRRAAPLMKPILEWFRTDEPQARVELRECRGKTGASMVYTRLPVTDMFRRIDEDTLLGMMETESSEPFFFVLRRVPGDRGLAAMTAN